MKEYYTEYKNLTDIKDQTNDETMRKMVEEDNESEKNEKEKRIKSWDDYVYDINKLLPSPCETESVRLSRTSAKKTPIVLLERLSSQELAKSPDVNRKRKLKELEISSNVKDSLRNLSKISRDDCLLKFSENLNDLIVKLNTTLNEIHETTAKELITLFAETRKGLLLLVMQEEDRNIYRETVYDEVTKMLDKFFDHINQRVEESYETMKWLQWYEYDALFHECVAKRAVVALLPEDAQAVRDHLSRKPH